MRDENVLARQVARVALGQFAHVARIIAGADLAPPATTEQQLIRAERLLIVPAGADPWHRDGWMFQTISWIAAHRVKPGVVLRSPHMIWAHKGFDGLQLEIDEESGVVTAAIVFEDKATENPRDTVRDEVWPDLRRVEAGERDNELVAEVSTLLRLHAAHRELDPDIAIQNIIWRQARRYRVSVTVGNTHADAAGRARLFKGYDTVAAGDVARRRGETLLVPELRPWMAQFADRAIAAVRAAVASHV